MRFTVRSKTGTVTKRENETVGRIRLFYDGRHLNIRQHLLVAGARLFNSRMRFTVRSGTGTATKRENETVGRILLFHDGRHLNIRRHLLVAGVE